MATSNFNMSFDPELRKQFTEIVADYGLTAPQAFKLFANQVVKTGVIPLSFDWRENMAERVPTAKLLNAIAELENGETTRYASMEAFEKAFRNEND
ncbi:type II toxin-antitoxin system RelB/DinJ family antitoxin [Kingella sp. (in: b-proteobacteria)]|uniref:type II toxin-antitoxin system RelB/DinJ family antitoxin n=1 Tax=Kingella sp. (in: b-proteobacteria) TaxID=2020713 RepID=UPI0026DB7003|nr:type II toxin-antitoxin system RelB/DinJ family antitoxin [Kingella sp. (in: b-proteobacteria)]MDO4656378.1 type II toxin-antitoxin system RelB/DinJ family antitoxin [Kingella sp. (in: b-proteobacteria)]